MKLLPSLLLAATLAAVGAPAMANLELAQIGHGRGANGGQCGRKQQGGQEFHGGPSAEGELQLRGVL